jgi:hypothetical protein
MSNTMLVVVVILLFVAGMGALAYAVFSSAKILPKLDEATKNMGEMPGAAQTMFRLGRVYYHSTTVTDNQTNATRDICDTTLTGQIVIIQLIYNSSDPPELCEVYADNLIQRKVLPESVPCRGQCPQEEVTLAVDVKSQDIYRQHEIKMCCDELCAQKALPILCR